MKRDWILRLSGLGLAALLVSSAAQAAGPYQFFSITPCRLIDTRGPTGLTGGPALAGDVQRNFPIDVAPTACGIPSDAAAAVLNFVVVAPQGGGHLRVWPFGTVFPGVATLNFDPFEPAIGNGAITPVTIDPNFQISVMLKTGGPSGHLVVDATGYFK
jgi:hypothetical protein